MSKQFISSISKYQHLYRDDRTGIAWIEDGSSGCNISVHPNIYSGGSVRGMKNLGYWDKKDRTVRSNGFIYNIDHFITSWDKNSNMYELEKIVADECRCQGCIERRMKESEKQYG